MKLNPFHRAGLLAAFLFLLMVGLSHADLPQDAQDAVNKGINAAKQQDYLQAIQFFQDARKIASDAPEIYYNLGLAESKIPGRELRAICWFEAYLAAVTNAPNAAAVKSQVVTLDVKNQNNISLVIKAVQDAHSQISSGGSPEVAGLWAGAGNMTEALKTMALIEDPKYKDVGYQCIAEGQAEAGDIAGAQKTVELIVNGSFKSKAQGAIAVEQIKAGDIVGAKNTFASAVSTADHIQDGLINDIETANRDSALIELAVVQAKVGDFADVQKTINLISERKKQDYARDTIQEYAQNNFDEARRVPIQIVTSDWTHKLDDDGSSQSYESDLTDEQLAEGCPLNSKPFLDLVGYLKSLPSSDNPYVSTPQNLFQVLLDTAKKMVKAKNIIDQILKQQAKPEALVQKEQADLDARLAEFKAKTIAKLVKAGDMAGAKKIVAEILDESLKQLVEKDVEEELKQ